MKKNCSLLLVILYTIYSPRNIFLRFIGLWASLSYVYSRQKGLMTARAKGHARDAVRFYITILILNKEKNIFAIFNFCVLLYILMSLWHMLIKREDSLLS